MSTMTHTKPQIVELGDFKLPIRITVKRLKWVKELAGLDLTSQDTGPLLEFATNPETVVAVCCALYKDHLKEASITEEDFEDLCGPDEIAALRTEVTEQMKSFSSFWRILSTQMENLQSGDTTLLLQQAKEAQQLQEAKGASGPSS